MDTLRPLGVLQVYRSIKPCSEAIALRGILKETPAAPGYNPRGLTGEKTLLKWLLTILLAVLVLGAFTPWLRRLGVRRMPGDVEIERAGRRYFFPFGSTLLFSLVAILIYWTLR